MELVTHRRWAKKTILDAMEKRWRKEHGAGKERHRRRFLKIQWSKKAPQEVTFKLRCEKCWGDDSESLLLPGPGSAFFFCIYTDCGSRPTCPVRRIYCPLILLERQNELHFLSPSRRLLLLLSGAHTCAYSHAKDFIHSSILKQQASFTTRKSIHSYPRLLPSHSENRGLLTKPWIENTGEHDHGCQHLLPRKTFHPQSNIRDAFSNGGPINYESAPKRQPFQWRTCEAKVIFKDNNNSGL